MKRRKKLRVAVSGGRTSAYMAKRLLEEKSDEYEMMFTFANTSFEDPDTLRFTNDLDKNFGLNLVWLEAVVNRGRVASTHKVVSYETAKRSGEVFADVVSKYGLPNNTFKLCTREMKANTMDSYAKDVWGDEPHEVAIGIRADERRRVSVNATKNKIVYPLIDMWPTTKEEVIDYFSQFDWDLNIPEHRGNCVTCFQKSDKKLNTIYREDPEAFTFFLELERKYKYVGPNNVTGPRRIFRGYRSTAMLINTFEILNNSESYRMFSEEDVGTCSESCEVYETEVVD